MAFSELPLLFMLVGGVLSVDLDNWCYHPSGDDCSWYAQCLVKRFPCEAANDSYANGFVDTICNEFTKKRLEFTNLGTRWIDDTRACLQKQLVPVLSKQDMTCQEIQTFAFQTHSYCYSTPPEGSPSFCDLPFSDWFRILPIIRQSFVRETSETLKQALQILGKCASNTIFGK